MTTTTVQTVTVGAIEAQAAIFTSAGGRGTYVVEAERANLDVFWQRYGHDAKRVAAYGLDDDSTHFYAFWVADCFDPLVAIVRAESWESAYEAFTDEFSDWMKIDDTDLKDYDDDSITYSTSGVPIDTEAVNGVEVQLLRVIVRFDAAETESK